MLLNISSSLFLAALSIELAKTKLPLITPTSLRCDWWKKSNLNLQSKWIATQFASIKSVCNILIKFVCFFLFGWRRGRGSEDVNALKLILIWCNAGFRCFKKFWALLEIIFWVFLFYKNKSKPWMKVLLYFTLEDQKKFTETSKIGFPGNEKLHIFLLFHRLPLLSQKYSVTDGDSWICLHFESSPQQSKLFDDCKLCLIESVNTGASLINMFNRKRACDLCAKAVWAKIIVPHSRVLMRFWCEFDGN